MKLTALLLLATLIASAQTPAEIRDIAEGAYIYAYPLVLVEATRGNAALNRLTHAQQFPVPESRNVIRPNADTLYSTAWIDLSREPILIEVPDSKDRYYLLQFMDAWTETITVPGKRTTGTAPRWFALVGPDWKGEIPRHIDEIDSPTNIVWLIGRTQTNGPSDYENVHAFQRGMRMMPLSDYPDGVLERGTQPAAAASPGPTPPQRVKAMDPVAFFKAFAEALKANPPHAADTAMVSDLAKIGIIPGKDFDPSRLNPDQLQALEEGARAASDRLENPARPNARPGWSAFNSNVGRYGTNYAARAAVARGGLGANPPEDAVYLSTTTDSTGQPLTGANRYRMHFEKSNLPPVRAFWSVTAYSQDGYFIPNPAKRYAIGDRDPLKFNPDGSLDLYIQSQRPEVETNWLPSGEASFNLTIRLYWPKDEILNGTWRPPAVERVP